MTGSGSSGARTTQASAPVAADRPSHRAAVLGSPVAHSLSPLLHNAGYAALGLSGWQYTYAEVTEPELVGFVRGLDESWRGLSLTMPLKEVAFEVAATVTEVARRAAAINTLVRRSDGGWDGDNTDVFGILESLRHVEHGGEAVVIGAGATARSAVVALSDLGVRRVAVAARRLEQAQALTAFASSQGMTGRAVPLQDWADKPPPLVVSTVPVGAGEALVASARAVHERLDTVTLFDVVYAPWPSPLAAAVQAAGGEAISGVEMLIHQAARQFELFTAGCATEELDIAVLRSAVRDR